ncbi:MAG: transcription termination/antitermination protein NusA [Ruminococcus sp.]|nr:transcription termination/antitermination protein NusA [Ruminococcus sp.]
MNKELFEALTLLEKENDIDAAALIETVKGGIMKAIKKDYPNCENISVEIEPETGKFEMKILKEIVEGEPEDPDNQISLDEARTISKRARVGGVAEIKLNPGKFGRVAAQNAKQSIKHEIKGFEREKLIEQYKDKVCECVPAVVQKVEPTTLNAVVTIDKNEVYFIRKEQIPGEVLKPGDIISVYVVGVSSPEKKPSIRISRTHRELVKRLFEREIPEIADGIVEVKAISRVAGSRSKVAVISHDPNVDAIGACIGPGKSRITAIVNELKGEKIDIILWSEDPEEFIAKALAPAEVKSVEVYEDEEIRECRVVVPNNQLSLAIGNKGQNAKLAAGLTGYRIDIIPEVPLPEEEPEDTDD